MEARCTSSLTLEVVFGSSDNFRSEDLIFDIVPFRSGYHALLGRTASARFNVVPHYAYLKLKIPGPRGVITVNGNMERSLRTEEHTAALSAEVQNRLIKPNNLSVIKIPDTAKRIRSTLSKIARRIRSLNSTLASADRPIHYKKIHFCDDACLSQ